MATSNTHRICIDISNTRKLANCLPLFQPPFRSSRVAVGNAACFGVSTNRALIHATLSLAPRNGLLTIPLAVGGVRACHPRVATHPASLSDRTGLVDTVHRGCPRHTVVGSIDVTAAVPPYNDYSIIVGRFNCSNKRGTLRIL